MDTNIRNVEEEKFQSGLSDPTTREKILFSTGKTTQCGTNQWNESNKQEHIPLSVCGHCKKDTKNDPDNRTEKVAEWGLADMLCEECRIKMDTEMVSIAIKYLKN